MATLGGAVSAAAELPTALADALSLAARASFVDALQAATVVAAAILFGAAVLAVRMLRNGVEEKG
jgi:DHA2 family multidrug resistance protein-like MFS transporter